MKKKNTPFRVFLQNQSRSHAISMKSNELLHLFLEGYTLKLKGRSPDLCSSSTCPLPVARQWILQASPIYSGGTVSDFHRLPFSRSNIERPFSAIYDSLISRLYYTKNNAKEQRFCKNLLFLNRRCRHFFLSANENDHDNCNDDQWK